MERYKIILFFAILSFAGWDSNSLSIRRIIKRVGIRDKILSGSLYHAKQKDEEDI